MVCVSARIACRLEGTVTVLHSSEHAGMACRRVRYVIRLRGVTGQKVYYESAPKRDPDRWISIGADGDPTPNEISAAISIYLAPSHRGPLWTPIRSTVWALRMGGENRAYSKGLKRHPVSAVVAGGR
jgi:hypothetical protein